MEGFRTVPLQRETWLTKQPVYQADHLAVWEKSVEFLDDPRFRSAYRRGVNSGHTFPLLPYAGEDDATLHIEWRVHVCCWAATVAARLPGDFVECGVNTGIFSLAICEYINFNATGKMFWLFDTFCGIPEEQLNERERALGRLGENSWYPDCWELAKTNFAPFPNARLVRGKVPDTLATVEIDRVSYLSLDMNIALPERAALEFFWPKLVPGALVVLDDYAQKPYEEQKRAIDEFAADREITILTLPTGQGMLIKPA
jgi:O-methyltransferase